MRRRGWCPRTRFDELDGVEQARWEASFDEDRAGQESSWQRLYREESGPAETFEQATVRGWAGTLSLIGLAITERGRLDGGEVVVDLTSEQISAAVEASDHLPNAEDSQIISR